METQLNFPYALFLWIEKSCPLPIHQSIPAAAWFVLVTITTVGYGEITPRSFLGRLITLPILVFGLLLITLPSFVLGREFSLVWERMTRDRVCLSLPTNRGITSPSFFLAAGERSRKPQLTYRYSAPTAANLPLPELNGHSFCLRIEF